MLASISYNITQNNSKNQSFTSRSNPIKPFVVHTHLGDITISEINYDTELTKKFARKVTLFLSQIFRKDLCDPVVQNYYSLPRKEKKAFFRFTQNYYTKKLLDKRNYNDLTVLTAKDSKGKMQGVCISYGSDELPDIKDCVLDLDSIAVNKQYRGYGIAKLMIKKLIESGKNRFSDMLLFSDNKCIKLYENLGFRQLNPKDPVQKQILEYFEKHYVDGLDYQTPHHIPLDITKPRWYHRGLNKAVK